MLDTPTCSELLFSFPPQWFPPWWDVGVPKCLLAGSPTRGKLTLMSVRGYACLQSPQAPSELHSQFCSLSSVLDHLQPRGLQWKTRAETSSHHCDRFKGGSGGSGVCCSPSGWGQREREGSVYVHADRNYYGDRVIEIIMGRRWWAQDQKDGKLENKLHVASICKNGSVPVGGNYRSTSFTLIKYRKTQASCCTWGVIKSGSWTKTGSRRGSGIDSRSWGDLGQAWSWDLCRNHLTVLGMGLASHWVCIFLSSPLFFVHLIHRPSCPHSIWGQRYMKSPGSGF